MTLSVTICQLGRLALSFGHEHADHYKDPRRPRAGRTRRTALRARCQDEPRQAGLTPDRWRAGRNCRPAHRRVSGRYLFDTHLTHMDLNLPPEILALAKASPWILVALAAIGQLGALLSPFASILAIRLARNDKERAAFLEHRRIERRPSILRPWRKRDEKKEEE